MDLKTTRRKLLVTLAVALGVCLLVILCSPIWFPWILRPLAGSYSAGYQVYERHGYSHFVVRNAAWTNASVSIRAERLRIQFPIRWLSHLAFRTTGSSPMVVASG
jgi:hypothetical protein